MISVIIAKTSQSNLLIRLSEDYFVDINNTNYVLIGTYTKSAWNASMNQITNTLYAVIDDKEVRNFEQKDMMICKECRYGRIQPILEEQSSPCLNCGCTDFMIIAVNILPCITHSA